MNVGTEAQTPEKKSVIKYRDVNSLSETSRFERLQWVFWCDVFISCSDAGHVLGRGFNWTHTHTYGRIVWSNKAAESNIWVHYQTVFSFRWLWWFLIKNTLILIQIFEGESHGYWRVFTLDRSSDCAFNVPPAAGFPSHVILYISLLASSFYMNHVNMHNQIILCSAFRGRPNVYDRE